MKRLNFLLAFFNLRGFLHFRLIDGKLKESKFLIIFRMISPILISYLVQYLHFQVTMSDFKNGIVENHNISMFFVISAVISSILGPASFMMVTIVNVVKSKTIFRFVKKCEKISENFQINYRKLELECFIYFLILHLIIIFYSTIGFLSNFTFNLRMLLYFSITNWMNTISFATISLSLFFVKFLKFLLVEVENDLLIDNTEKTSIKLLKINNLIKNFQQAFGIQLSWCISQIIMTIMFMVRQN